MKSVQIWSFFWSEFSCIRTEYGKIRTRKNSVFGHFSRSENYQKNIQAIESNFYKAAWLLFAILELVAVLWLLIHVLCCKRYQVTVSQDTTGLLLLVPVWILL